MKPGLLLGLFLLGCAPTAKLSTPSGKPEIIIEGISTPYILNDIAVWSMQNGFGIGERTDSTVQTYREGTVLLDTWQTGNQPTKDIYMVPHTNLYTVRRQGDTATIYMRRFKYRKNDAGGYYSSESKVVEKELSSQRELEMMQADLEQIAKFIRLRKL